jgi:predicted ferric reductase
VDNPPTEGFAGRPSLLVPAVAALEGVLLLLWLRADSWSGRTTDGAQWLGTISSFTGLSGVVLFAVTIILSGRFRIVESLIGGLDKVYRTHHVLGALSFVLVLVHPAVLAWKYAQISLERSAHLFGPSTRWPLLAGQLALAAMIPALVVTLYLTVRHQTLVALQRLLGVTMIPVAYHSLFTGGDSVRSTPLRLYLALLCALGFAALVKHSLLGRKLDRHRPYTVTSVRHVAPDLAELRLAPAGSSLKFVPGQFAYLRFPNATPTRAVATSTQQLTGEPHPFSIASPPSADEVRFVVKMVGDWTRHIEDVAIGSPAVIEGPYGRFSHRFVPGRSQLWIAGGIGITPMLSMAASLAPTDCPYDVDLVWVFPSSEHAPFVEELQQLAAQRAHFRVHVRGDDAYPLLTAEALRTICDGSPGSPLQYREVLMCGPAAMRDALRAQLLDAGVSPSQIHDEEFRYA